MVGWAPSAFWKGLREVRRSHPEVIFSTSSPYTTHVVAWAIHRATGVPWVADFRDEWSNNEHSRDQLRIVRWLSRRTERAICRDAERVVVVGDYFDIEGADSDRTVEIPNGVDEADLPVVSSGERPSNPRLCLSHVGTLYGQRDCAPIFESLSRLVETGRLDPERLELRFVGNSWLGDLRSLIPASIRVTEVGYVDHLSAVEEMSRADALLFYVAPASRAPSGKLFEYLASDRPILCVARRDNLAWRLVESWDAGQCAAPKDRDGIDAAILELVARWEDGRLLARTGARQLVLEAYSRRALVSRVADVLDEAAPQ
jgi:hypothetical protein